MSDAQLVLSRFAEPLARHRWFGRCFAGTRDNRGCDFVIRTEDTLLNSGKQPSDNFINTHVVLPVRAL